MKTPFLASLALVASLAVAPCALAQPGIPPGIAQRGSQSDILTWFDRVPARHLAFFGNADRRELLNQQGAIYDKANGFIEVPMPGDPDKNDVQKLQVKLYRANAGLVVAVSLIAWNQPRVPGELTFYGVTGDGQLLDVTQQLFPYQLEKIEEDGKVVAFQSADLPRNGTTIYTGVPGTDIPNDEFRWDKTRFTKREAKAQN